MKRTGKSYFREYYVIFDEGEAVPPFLKRWFCKPGFGHCDVLMALDDKQSIILRQTLHNVEIFHYPYNVHLLAEDFARRYTVVYVPRCMNEKLKIRLGVLIPSCVSMCQRVTGLTYNAITPYAYFRALLKNGGHKVG